MRNIYYVALFSVFLSSNLIAKDLTMRDKLQPGIYASMQIGSQKILVQLDDETTTKTASNFIDLATGKKRFMDKETGKAKKITKPFYNGTQIHRVYRDNFIQAGCPFGDGTGDPGYQIEDETSKDMKITTGSLFMYRDKKGVNGSQFILAAKRLENFDGKFPVFGKTVYGTNAIQSLTRVRTGHKSKPLNPLTLKQIRIFRSTKEKQITVAQAFMPPKTKQQLKVENALAKKRATEALYREMAKEPIQPRLLRKPGMIFATDVIGTPQETLLDPGTLKRLKTYREYLEKEGKNKSKTKEINSGKLNTKKTGLKKKAANETAF